MTAAETVSRYLEAFNRGDVDTMLDCLTDDIHHEVNQGGVRVGKELFTEFCAHMNRCYRERLSGIVVMPSADGTRCAAEFELDGEYLATDEGLPEAKGQKYHLRVGSFFALEGGRIARVTTCYNLTDWLRQVGG